LIHLQAIFDRRRVYCASDLPAKPPCRMPKALAETDEDIYANAIQGNCLIIGNWSAD
jgi:hypothetical protein